MTTVTRLLNTSGKSDTKSEILTYNMVLVIQTPLSQFFKSARKLYPELPHSTINYRLGCAGEPKVKFNQSLEELLTILICLVISFWLIYSYFGGRFDPFLFIHASFSSLEFSIFFSYGIGRR